jgi:hypothetical protein
MFRGIILACLLAGGLSGSALAQQPVQPRACAITTVTTGGTAVIAMAGPDNGFYIVNPLTLGDQGIAAAEPLFVDPVGTATTAGFGTNTAIAPGNSYSGIPGATGNISVNAATSGHRFTCVRW